ncbi:hypothetical protein JW868_01390 [Candidatus Woesearchaeota archaeon]|nr:hypothetical protein [Candidatus Woesearchaeota archaeon]
MASTFQGLALFSTLNPIFVFLLVFVLLYAVLEKMSWVGKDKKGLNALIALFGALIVVSSTSATKMISFMGAWFFVLFFFVIMMIIALGSFGMKEDTFVAAIKSDRLYMWLIIFGLLIAIFAFGNAFGQRLLDKGSDQVDENGVPIVVQEPADQVIVYDDAGNPIYVETDSNDYGSNVLQTIVNPKVLGFIIVILIGSFTVTFMTKPN